MNTMQRRSWAVTAVALMVSTLSVGLTAWYLWPAMPIGLLPLLLAAAIVAAPLLTRWPLSTERALKTAAIWAVAGSLPGMYVFGVCVFLAAPVLAVGVLIVHALETSRPAWCPCVQIRAR